MKRFRKLIIASLLLSFAGIAYGASTWTSLLHLQKAGRGTANWDTITNNNWQRIDNAWSDYQNALTDLPEVYQLPGTFNGTAGVVINLPKTVGATDDYAVNIQPSSYGGTDIADIKVVRGLSSFTVYSEGNNLVDTFIATVHYESDLATYGNQVFRRWIVSPDASITDHTDASVAGSLAQILTVISGATSEIVFPASHTYVMGWGKSYVSHTGLDFNKALAKTITKAGGSFITTNGFAAGMPIHVSGTTLNDGYYRIDSLTETAITVVEDLVDETVAGAAVVQMAIPSYVNLVFDKGAMLDDNSTGYSLWMYNTPTSLASQVFQWTGAVYFERAESIYPEWFGAVADDVAVCSATATNQAVASFSGNGGKIMFGTGTYYAINEPFEVDSKVLYFGVNRWSTWLKMGDNANLRAVVWTPNWDAMVAYPAPGAWWVDTHGVKYGFGFFDIGIDGNRANNTTGYGVLVYGKGFHVNNINVMEASLDGWYSRCGRTVGQHDYRDLPESQFYNIYSRSNDGVGIRWHGSHDSVMNNVISAYNESYGFIMGGDTTSLGSSDIDFMHTYGNDWTNSRTSGVGASIPGFYANVGSKIQHCQFEDGSHFDVGANMAIGLYHTTMGKNRNHPAIRISASNMTIKHIKLSLRANNVYNPTGIQIDAGVNRTFLDSIKYYCGASMNNIALDIQGGGTIIGNASFQQVTSAGYDWAALEDYNLGEYIDGTGVSNRVFEVTTAGTSGATEPVWDTTIGNTTVDGSGPTAMVWTCRAQLSSSTCIRMGDVGNDIDKNHLNHIYAVGFATFFKYPAAGNDNYVRMICAQEVITDTVYDGVAPNDSDDFHIEGLSGTTRKITKWERKWLSTPVHRSIPIGTGALWLDRDESGKNYTNSGATDTVSFRLPYITAEMIDPPVFFTFSDVAAGDYDIRVQPGSDGELVPTWDQIIGTDTAGDYMALITTGHSMTVACFELGKWTIVSAYGTPTKEP